MTDDELNESMAKDPAAYPLRPHKNRDLMMDAVISERIRQDAKWGGAVHDDRHIMDDWQRYIRLELFRMMLARGPKTTRERYIRIAALAVAAAESLCREYGMKDEPRPPTEPQPTSPRPSQTHPPLRSRSEQRGGGLP